MRFQFSYPFRFRRSVPLAQALTLALAVLLGAAPRLAAQTTGNTGPRIGYVYPAGGRQGTEFPVSLGGQFLDGATNVYVSGTGARAVVLEHKKPLTGQQANALREKLEELQTKRAAARRGDKAATPVGGATNAPATNVVWTAEDETRLADIRAKLASYQRRPTNPAIVETVILKVALDTNAAPGMRELRLGTPNGLSNPVAFSVGQLAEFVKPDARLSPDPPRPLIQRRNADPKSAPPAEMRVTLPATVNGQILPGGVDRYRFRARKGQEWVAAVSARELIPYLPDAVPGWFQATLTLYDAKGRELAYQDDYRFNPDPVLRRAIPEDGEYVLEIKDAIYRGREDFVYRITLGEIPFITGIFPLGGREGDDGTVELRGWNLPRANLPQSAIGTTAGRHWVSVSKDGLLSNRLPYVINHLPERAEREPNNDATKPEPALPPVIINGRIGQPGDVDVFRFQGKAGQPIVAEVNARRLGSPLDSTLRLTGPNGVQVAINDDHEDKGAGLNTHHADSYFMAVLPADGAYLLTLGDAQRQGGNDFAYRLRISSPQPDFELRLVPSSLTLRPGLCLPVKVYALRKDGFTNEIHLTLKDPPEGFHLGGARIPAGHDGARITITAPPKALDQAVTLSLEGKAIVGGREQIRPVVPAEDMMQAFAYRHLVPAGDLQAMVTGRGAFRSALKMVGGDTVKIPCGGTARVRIAAPPALLGNRLRIELSEPPEGVSLKEVLDDRRGLELVFECDAAKVKPGLQGNLIANIVRPGDAGTQKQKKQGAGRVAVIATLPAIPFDVVKP